MEIAEHLARAESFERSAAKLEPIEDAPLYVVFLMRAGTNRVNAALHSLGVTDTSASSARIGDLNHTYKPRLEGAVPPEVQPMFASLKQIEDLRADHVRGPLVPTPAIAEACRKAHAEIVALTGALIEQRRQVA